jgi:hypothetical protein
MSKKNGDRSRADRLQKKKLLRRKRAAEVRQSLNTAPPVAPAKEENQ